MCTQNMPTTIAVVWRVHGRPALRLAASRYSAIVGPTGGPAG